MLLIAARDLAAIAAHAEHAYPGECCGLLVGRGRRIVRVSRVVPSSNIAAGRDDRFEVDPKLRFDLMRELGEGPERIVGHYHSHPDHPARPSPTDLACAFEPELLWLILAVSNGQAVQSRAWRLAPDGGRFVEERLEVSV